MPKGVYQRTEKNKHTKEFKDELRQRMMGNTYRRGTKLSDEQKELISEKMKGNKHLLGHKHSEESKQKMSESHKNPSDETRWGNGKATRGKHLSEEIKRKISEAHKGFKHTEESKQKMSEIKKGKNHVFYGTHRPLETRIKIGKLQRGKLHHNWQGGLVTINKIIRKCINYKEWRSKIFKRDNYTCQICSKYGDKIHAHHIRSISSIIKHHKINTLRDALICKELWDINNGITLCRKCHKELHQNKYKVGDINVSEYIRN
jgi:hypothetical protein